MDPNKASQARPKASLEQEIMDPSIAKNDREWWARTEIERLRVDVGLLDAECKQHVAEIKQLREELHPKPHPRDCLASEVPGASCQWPDCDC